MLTIPSRREALVAAKEQGMALAAVFPIHYPRELLRAHGLHPVEVWGPPGIEAHEGAVHFQAYTCDIVQHGVSWLLQGGLDDAAVVLVPHACDALQGAGSVLRDFLAPKQPVLTFYPPRATRAVDERYLVGELQALSQRLSAVSGVSPDASELQAAIEAEAEADGVSHRLLAERTSYAVDDEHFFRLLRSREYLSPDVFCELAGALPRGKSPAGGIPLMLSGIVPEPMSLYSAIAEMGAHVVDDDFACTGRRIYPSGQSADPWIRMAERLQGAPPDPMRGCPIAERCEYLIGRMERSGAKGLVVYDVKFCEPELFDLPILRERMEAAGFRVLHIEIELAATLAAQTVTRLQAFVETLQ